MKPIAIIGIGCRFPGAQGPEALWTIAREALCQITETPADRWQVADFYSDEAGTPGKMSSLHGGFVSDVDRFDAGFFGVSPREAAQMDPQQRLLLEVCWEALENAGIPASDLAGRIVGNFVGIQRNDYGRIMADPERYNAYTVAGNQFSMTASRISHFFDLRGPCLALDAGCSSVLAALHLACASLETEESNLVIAGGVHLSLAPHDSVAASQAWMLSPSGTCRSFDAAADGYVRSEGCGLFVLKRLEDALRDGDSIRAVIRGTAFFQEGRPGGFTSPWGPEVERTFSRALERAGVSPGSIGYVEAHGVGSPVADATEYQALARVLLSGPARSEPCYLGSIKPNIGHTETAAGAASLIKAIHVLESGEIPPLFGFERINPDIEEGLRELIVPKELTPFPDMFPRRAAVNAFGLGGMNATIVLEAAEPSPMFPPGSPPKRPEQTSAAAAMLCLSARSPASLRELARRYSSFIETNVAIPVSELQAATVRRANFQYRAVVLGSTKAALLAGLAHLEGNPSPGPKTAAPEIVQGETLSQDPRLFVLLRSSSRPDPIDSAATLRRTWDDLGVRVSGIVVDKSARAAAAALAGAGTAAEIQHALDSGSVRSLKPIAIAVYSAESGERLGLQQLIARPFESAPVSISAPSICATHSRDCELLLDLPEGALYEAHQGALLCSKHGEAWLGRTLAELWVRGAAIDFRKLEQSRPGHVALPTYPFERERYWIDDRGPGTGLAPDFSSARDQSKSLAKIPAPGAFAALLDTGDAAEKQRALTTLLRQGVAAALGKSDNEIPTNVSLRDLGLASIDVLQLMESLRAASGIELEIARFMDQPSIEEMASRIVFGTGEDLRVVNLSAEGNLEDGIDATGLPPSANPARSVLLTGATGFLGAFLLRELLDRTEATIYCLVRAIDSLEAEGRLRQNLVRYGLSTEGFEVRVHALIGDLDKPLLGLSYERFDLLGTRLDAIYHCGALVNWAYPYRTLREANVQGTEEVVRLAAHMKRKPIHHVSTIGVFPLGQPQLGVLRERDGLIVPERSEWLGTGYNQSKWVAEKLLYTAASRRGLQVSIYRPGFVTGRSDTGVTQTGRHDFIAAFLKGCIQMGEAPDWDVVLDLMPVDYLARAIVELSLRPAAPGAPMAYNMINPEPLKYQRVYDLLRSLGYSIQTVPYSSWRSKVLALAREPGDHALFPFWPYYAELTVERSLRLQEHMGDRLPFDDKNVRDGLLGRGLRCPAVSELLPIYSEFFRQAGYFPVVNSGAASAMVTAPPVTRKDIVTS